ncbi:hypothetical protein K438DRAFT_1974606 [Mycena galopus ATCC 62051]|nr:hypothetical protein K438DRAFT_1974606 [Mycena galopus ATCC 62051]
MPLTGAEPMRSPLAPAANDSARDDDELTITANDDRVAGSINPPSVRVNCAAPAAYTYDSGCGWGGAANTRRHEVERKTTPVPFIRISEPKPVLDNEAALVGGKRKR